MHTNALPRSHIFFKVYPACKLHISIGPWESRQQFSKYREGRVQELPSPLWYANATPHLGGWVEKGGRGQIPKSTEELISFQRLWLLLALKIK